MSLLYVTESGTSLGINGGHIVVNYSDGRRDEIPKETVTGISLFGQVQLTAAMIRFCLETGIRVGFFSHTGKFYGMLTDTGSADAGRIKKQSVLQR